MNYLKKWKVKFINWIYWRIGTRVKVEDIVQDLPDLDAVWNEFSIVLENWKITKFKGDTLSPIRLEACVRALIKLKGGNWRTDNLQGTIEEIWNEKFDLYDDCIVRENGEEVPLVEGGATGIVATYFLLLLFMVKKEMELAN